MKPVTFDGLTKLLSPNGNNIGRINPTTGVITEFVIPTSFSFPGDITAGPGCTLWFTEGGNFANNIGQVS